MAIRIGAGLSTLPDARAGGEEAAGAARAALGPADCDVAVVFAAGTHLAAPEATLEAVHETLEPRQLVGCGAGGVLAGGREVEDGTAVSVWAASLGGGSATPFHAVVENGEQGVLAGLPDLAGSTGAVLLADPFSFPADPLLKVVSDLVPDVPVVGGLASARLIDGSPALFLGEGIVPSGAVGLRFDGVALEPCVSQGAAPIGPELTITAAEGNVIVELAGRPAYERLQEVVAGLTPHETDLLERSGGILLGIVVDPNKPDYVQGDFLVRGLVGADPDTGQVAVGTDVRPGQVVRLHARDAASADRDLREALSARMLALGGRVPAGALLISCNGRGAGMFGHAHHDASALDHALGGAPAAGFFAAGEIGPIGGEYFVHGFTATVAVFA